MRRRRGFTFVTLVSFVGTLALAVAIVQTDAALTALRRAAHAAARIRARTAGSSLAASLPAGASGIADLPGAHAQADAASIRVTVSVRGRPLEVVVPR